MTSTSTLSTQALASCQLDILNRLISSNTTTKDGLLSGKIGVVLYLFELSKYTQKEIYDSQAQEILEDIFIRLYAKESHLNSSGSWSNGIAGLAHVSKYLVDNNFIELDLDDEFEFVDDFLFKIAIEWLNNDATDYLHASVGILHYFIDRLPHAKLSAYAQEIIIKLSSRAIIDEKGLRFNNSILERTEPEYNLSLSHGLSGVLLILLRAYEKGIEKEIITEMVSNGIKFLLNFRQESINDKQNLSTFTSIVTQKDFKTFYGNRLAWCYGDLNQVLLLYRAGKALNVSLWTQIAEEVGLATTQRTTKAETAVSDTHFCHGAAGVAQFYRTLYTETNVELYHQAYEFWITQTLSLLEDELKNDFYADKECDLLEGLPGIALTLISYLSDQDHHWNKLFLL